MRDEANGSLSQARESIPASGRLADDLRSDFARSVAATVANRIGLILIGVVTSVLVARALGPEGRGLFAVATVIGGIGVQFGNLGLHASNTWAVARDPRLLGSLIANSLLVSLGLGGIGAFVIWTALTTGLVESPLPAGLLALALLSIPLGLAHLLLQNLLLGTQQIRTFNLLELGAKLTAVLALGGLILAGAVSAPSAFAANISGSLAAATVALIILMRQSGRRVRARPSLLIEHSRYAGKAYLSALFSFLVLRADVLMIQYFRGPDETGYYSIAVALADLTYLLPVVVGTLLFPKLAASADQVRQRQMATRVAGAMAAIMTTIGIIAAASSGFAISLLYGSEFEQAAPAFVWLMPGIVLLAVHTVLMNYYAARGMPNVAVLAPLLGLVLNVTLNAVLIPQLGIVGASIASSASYGLMLAVSAWYFTVKEKAST